MNKKQISGIYAIRNKTNGKVYIGSSKSLYYRWNQSHRPLLRKNKHGNAHLQHAWNKCGEENFEHIILEECVEGILADREEYWIEYHQSWKRKYGYNLTRYAEGRIVISEETKQKMKKAQENKHGETWDKINNLYISGLGKNTIAKQLGVSREMVYDSLERNGLHKNEGKGSIVKLTVKLKKEIQDLREEGSTWEEIVKLTGVSKTQLYRACETTCDGVYGGKTTNRTNYKTMTTEVEEQAIKLRNEGKSWKEIATKLGVNRTLFYRHGLANNMPEKIRIKITDEVKQRALKMRSNGMEWKDIATNIGCTERSFFKHGLHKQ